MATHFELKDPPAAATSQPSPLRLGSIRPRTSGGTAKSLAYTYRRFLYHYDIMLAGLFLKRAAEITGDQTCRAVAQRQLDWVMGCNPFDASAIEGVGYNQPPRGIYGEFFPPTPQIPGAVSINLVPASFDPQRYGGVNEYDMPPTGAALWLMAEQAKQSGK